MSPGCEFQPAIKWARFRQALSTCASTSSNCSLGADAKETAKPAKISFIFAVDGVECLLVIKADRFTRRAHNPNWSSDGTKMSRGQWVGVANVPLCSQVEGEV